MAANTRAKTVDWSLNEILPSTSLTKIDVNAAQSVNRTNSTGGWRRVAISYLGTSDSLSPHDRISYIAGNGRILFDNTAGEEYFEIATPLPVGHIIGAVRAKILPEAGHTGQPGSLPVFSVYRCYNTNSAEGTGTYTWVDITTYEAGFYLTATPINITVTAGETWRFAMRPEYGANSVKGMELRWIEVYMTLDTTYGGPDFTHWA